nr:hypothetical protein [Armatimonadota bacterium]
MLPVILFLITASVFGVAAKATENSSPSPYIYGTLGSEAGRSASDYAAGIRLELLEVGWDRYEPQEGKFDPVYIADLKRKAAALRAVGMQVDLDFGIQYPPGWLFRIPNSHYVDQFGDVFSDRLPGMNGVNAIFNAAVRVKQAEYVRQVLKDLGTDFYAVRLGWGWFGELNFPPNSFADHKNCYWAFDAVAQGKG